MHVQVSGKQIDLGDALPERVHERIGEIAQKYMGRALDGHVVFSREGTAIRCDCQLHLASGLLLQSSGANADAHISFDQAADRLEKQLRRHKRRLRNHHDHDSVRVPVAEALAYVLKADLDGDETESNEGAPAIIAESMTNIQTLTVSQAVLQLDLIESDFLFFRNAAHSGLNLVYRRPDGHIGWIDPEGTRGVAA